MRTLILLLAAAISLGASAQTTITASHIQNDLSGDDLASGYLCATPVNSYGQPTIFTSGTGGQVLPNQVCWAVTNGVLAAATVADTSLTTPAIGYALQVQSTNHQVLYNFSQPIYPSGATWSLDAWTPTQNLTTVPSGLQYSAYAPQNRCAAPSIDYTPSGIYSCVGSVWVPVTTSNNNESTSPKIGIIYVSPSCSAGQTNCYPVHDDGQVVWESATFSAGSTTVHCPACNFSSTDVGKLFFATNASHYGYYYQNTSVVTCGQTTIASVQDASDVTLAAACQSASGGDSPVIWGTDDSTLLANAWTQAVNQCATLQLPGGNAQGTGPAIMLVQQAEFNTPAGGVSRANCSLGSEALRSGIALRGVDINSTVIIPTPNFSFTTCTYGLSGQGCFGSNNDGANLSDFTIWGGGNSDPSGATSSSVGIDIDAQVSVSPDSGNNALHDIVLMGWGSGSSGIGTGLLIEGGTTICNGVDVDGFGQVGVKLGAGMASCSQLQSVDSYSMNVVVAGTGTVFNSYGGYYGYSYTQYGCDVHAYSGATFNSFGDMIAEGQGSSVPNNAVCYDGTVHLYGSNLNVGTTQYSSGASGTGTLYTSGSYIAGYQSLYNEGSVHDQGGNTFSGIYVCNACTGLYGASSFEQTAAASSNFALSTGWGTSAAISAVSGTSKAFLLTVTNGSASLSASPTITFTFPTAYLQAPIFCTANIIGGTNPAGIFKAATPSSSSVVFTFSLTPTASDTEQITGTCSTE